ncbi:hypothetical protein NPIL_615831 [Nephila pilipes]|uniref:Uncharacterized protein n=1 Tax=Nephila pilipes TaxID=299642 RepID=A0A8X6QLE5_NEPPI|nr:hypothetical protein NPIL_615831 [Nephila pilipes]
MLKCVVRSKYAKGVDTNSFHIFRPYDACAVRGLVSCVTIFSFVWRDLLSLELSPSVPCLHFKELPTLQSVGHTVNPMSRETEFNHHENRDFSCS